MLLNQLHGSDREDLTTQLTNLKQKYLQLEQTLDQLSTEKWDLEDTIRKYETERTSAREIKRLAEELEIKAELSKRLDKEIERLTQNETHARQTINHLSETIRLAKIEMDKLRAEKVNQEHLARKLVELSNANATLTEQNQKYKSEISRAHQELNKLCDALLEQTL